MQNQLTEPVVLNPQQNLKPVPVTIDTDSNQDYKQNWKKWLNYQSIVKQIPFFLFLALLAVIYIYNGHAADKMIRSINQTTKEVKELKYEYKTVKSEVMFRSKQSELSKAVEPLGLKELTVSPPVLTDETEKKDALKTAE
jgi:hypothetical protein